MSNYPSTLPSPQLSGYQVVVDYGMSSVTFEHGNTRQRRGVKQERYFFTYSVVLTQYELWIWQSWANQYGYDYHYEYLETHYSGMTSSRAIPHYIRYISDITITPIDLERFVVTLQAEMDPNTRPLGVVEFTGNWYVGGTPAAPSNSNSIIAGTPASPSNSNTIIAGSPGFPAA